MSDSNRPALQSVRTSIRVVEALYELDGAGVTELADYLGMAKSSVHRHLSTLNDENYVARDDGEYHLSLQFLELGEYVQYRDDIRVMAEPKVEELSEETGERAQFVVEEHGYVRYVHRSTAEEGVKTISGTGKRVRMHAIAGGKAILAFLPEAEVHEILDRRGLPAFTENTVTDRDALFGELATVRERRVSFDDEECVAGLRAVGVPVLGPDEEVLGALTVAGPKNRLKGAVYESEIPDLLLGVANELELRVTFE